MARQAALERRSDAMTACPVLGQALQHVAHPVIRSRGTVGGTIAHADASAEMPTVLTTLDGRVTVHGTAGSRTIAASDLFEFHLTTSLAPDEVLTEVEFPALPARSGSAFHEYARRHGDYAIAGICAVVTLDEAGALADVRIGCSGIAPTPVRAREAEAALRGAVPEPAAFEQAGELASACVDAVDEEQASVAYRRRLVRTLTARALADAAERARATTQET
jgi:carbon-monoxide dehydrogenase medium subunit